MSATQERIGVYICHCGTNIAGTVDPEEVARFAADLPGVVVARAFKYMCSDPGQDMVKQDIQNLGLTRVVVASCSPLMHERTFRTACQEAGLNPFLFQMANIREHCSWTLKDREQGTEKAKGIVAAAVRRVPYHEPLRVEKVPVTPATLIVGGGIAGIEAALQIAEAGKKVYLVEKESSIGGHMAKLDKTFPTLDCAACILTPKMVDVGKNPNIELMTCASVEAVEGYVGNFKVRVRQKARYVDLDKCTGCGECAKVCPVDVPNEFDEGMTTRKAIYRSFPQAVPGAFLIDHPQMAPCKAACPIGQDVQGYMALVRQGKFQEAHALIRRTNPLPGLCGRVCYHLCEENCRRAVVDEPLAIRDIKRFVVENTPVPEELFEIQERTGKKVAIVGSGPAGLTAAHDLALRGHDVVVFEREAELGGMTRLAIPPYRLPRTVLDSDIEVIRKLGVRFKPNTPVDADSLGTLCQEYDAVFVATGAPLPITIGLENEDAPGVIPGIEFLRRVSLGEEILGQHVAVIGGGNTAIDAARTALRLGAETVRIYYRRSRAEMPASDEEIEALLEEGIEIEFLVAPTKVVVEDGRVVGLELQRMELGEPDESGRRRPVPVPRTETVVEADTIIPAVSQRPDVAFVCEQGLELTRWGTLTIDELTCGTTVPGLFAGGDAVHGPASVIEAMADGKRAAQAMDNYLSGRPVGEGLKPPARPLEPPTEEERLTLRIETTCKPRVPMPVLDPGQRVCSFDEVELGYTAAQAMEEAARCLNCGVCSGCRECAKVCEAGAIDYEMEDTVREIEVGAVILATGFELFDASRAPQYGYGRLDNVYTSLEVERLCEASGPTQGKVLLRDGREPESVAILHCIGSRDKNYNEYCSRVCCMYSLKLAHLIQEKTEARVYEFYIDMRAFGKGYEEFYERIQREGVTFVRGKGAEVTQEDGRLVVLAEDTELGRPVRVPVDMVVLSVGLEPRRDAHEVSRLFNVSRTADGFFLEAHPKLRPVDTNVDGVFLAGACQGPKDIPDTVAQGAAAAMRAVALMDKGWVEIEPSVAEVNIALCSGCGDCIALCPSQAIERVEGHAEVNATLCKGCGTCVVACRPKAITLKHFDDRQVVAELEGLLSRMAYELPVTAEVLE